MMNSELVTEIRELTCNILICGENFYIMKHSTDRLYAIFSEITGITADNYNREEIILPSGKAISPSGAAHCLLEFKRTAIFLRGIDKAIQQKLAGNRTSPIQLLYAGTGPFATLVVPILTLYTSAQLQVDLLDINKRSLEAAQKVIGELGLTEFVKSSFLSDAATFLVEREYDIVISETMQAALKKEPQVAIMQNLIPQMNNQAIFIPESITVSAVITSGGHWDAESMSRTGINVLIQKKLFTSDKLHLDSTTYRSDFTIDEPVGNCRYLQLHTTINVFNDEWLEDSDCSLTLPVKVCILDENQTGTFSFWYEQGEIPGVRCQISGSEQIYDAINSKTRRS